MKSLKRIISIALTLSFLFTNIGLAQDSFQKPSPNNSMTLAAPSMLDDIAENTSHDKPFGIAMVGLEETLIEMYHFGGDVLPDGVEELKKAFKLLEDRRGFRPLQVQEHTVFNPAGITVCYPKLEKVREGWYMVPVIVMKNGKRGDYRILFSTNYDEQSGGFLTRPIVNSKDLEHLRGDEIPVDIVSVSDDKVRASIVRHAEVNEKTIDPWIEAKMKASQYMACDTDTEDMYKNAGERYSQKAKNLLIDEIRVRMDRRLRSYASPADWRVGVNHKNLDGIKDAVLNRKLIFIKAEDYELPEDQGLKVVAHSSSDATYIVLSSTQWGQLRTFDGNVRRNQFSNHQTDSAVLGDMVNKRELFFTRYLDAIFHEMGVLCDLPWSIEDDVRSGERSFVNVFDKLFHGENLTADEVKLLNAARPVDLDAVRNRDFAASLAKYYLTDIDLLTLIVTSESEVAKDLRKGKDVTLTALVKACYDAYPRLRGQKARKRYDDLLKLLDSSDSYTINVPYYLTTGRDITVSFTDRSHSTEYIGFLYDFVSGLTDKVTVKDAMRTFSERYSYIEHVMTWMTLEESLKILLGRAGKLAPDADGDNTKPATDARGAVRGAKTLRGLSDTEHRGYGPLLPGINTFIESLITQGNAYAFGKYNRAQGDKFKDDAEIRTVEDESGLPVKLNTMQKTNFTALMDWLKNFSPNVVVLHGLKDLLIERNIAPDLYFHYGLGRNTIYIDEDDLLYLLSLKDGFSLIKSGLEHEKLHIDRPGVKERDIEAQAVTKTLRDALNRRAFARKTAFVNYLSPDVSIRKTFGHLLTFDEINGVSVDLELLKEPAIFCRPFEGGPFVMIAPFWGEESYKATLFTIGKDGPVDFATIDIGTTQPDRLGDGIEIWENGRVLRTKDSDGKVKLYRFVNSNGGVRVELLQEAVVPIIDRGGEPTRGKAGSSDGEYQWSFKWQGYTVRFEANPSHAYNIANGIKLNLNASVREKGRPMTRRGTGQNYYDVEVRLDPEDGFTFRVKSGGGYIADGTIKIETPNAAKPAIKTGGNRATAADAASAKNPDADAICDAVAMVPQEFASNGLDQDGLGQGLGSANLNEKSALIFSEKMTFGAEGDDGQLYGIGVLLPQIVAGSNMKVVVVAPTERQKALIDKLNKENGLSDDKRIRYVSSISEAKSIQGAARYYYYKTDDEEDPGITGITTFSRAVRQIIEILGRVKGISEPKQIQMLYEAARKFAVAA